jgi:hypothetical protein
VANPDPGGEGDGADDHGLARLPQD